MKNKVLYAIVMSMFIGACSPNSKSNDKIPNSNVLDTTESENSSPKDSSQQSSVAQSYIQEAISFDLPMWGEVDQYSTLKSYPGFDTLTSSEGKEVIGFSDSLIMGGYKCRTMLEKMKAANQKDLSLFRIVDSLNVCDHWRLSPSSYIEGSYLEITQFPAIVLPIPSTGLKVLMDGKFKILGVETLSLISENSAVVEVVMNLPDSKSVRNYVHKDSVGIVSEKSKIVSPAKGYIYESSIVRKGDDLNYAIGNTLRYKTSVNETSQSVYISQIGDAGRAKTNINCHISVMEGGEYVLDENVTNCSLRSQSSN